LSIGAACLTDKILFAMNECQTAPVSANSTSIHMGPIASGA
jgi:hypothetical protein